MLGWALANNVKAMLFHGLILLLAINLYDTSVLAVSNCLSTSDVHAKPANV